MLIRAVDLTAGLGELIREQGISSNQHPQHQGVPSFATLIIALRLTPTSSSVVAQLETLMRMAV